MPLDIDACRRQRPYSRREYIGRAFWALAGPLCHFCPRPLFGWWHLLLGLFGARVHLPWNLSLGDEASNGEWALIYKLGPVTIGDRANPSAPRTSVRRQPC